MKTGDVTGSLATPPAVHARADLTANDIEVIRERHFGWEQAAPGTLAAIFGVSVQKINAVLNTPPKASPNPDNSGGIEGQAAHCVKSGSDGGSTYPEKLGNAASCATCGHARCSCTDWAWGIGL